MNAPPHSTQGSHLKTYLVPRRSLLKGPTSPTSSSTSRARCGSRPWRRAASATRPRASTRPSCCALARQIASLAHQGVSREHPPAARPSPGGERVADRRPPGHPRALALAIRKQVVANLTLATAASGALDSARRSGFRGPDQHRPTPRGHARQRRHRHLPHATRCGPARTWSSPAAPPPARPPSSTPCSRKRPATSGLIVIEDTLRSTSPTPTPSASSPCAAARARPRSPSRTRCRPRYGCAPTGSPRASCAAPRPTASLRAVNTGHPGSITTVHADSPKEALDQLALMVPQAGVNLGAHRDRRLRPGVVEAFVQLSRRNGRRVVSETARSGSSASAGRRSVACPPAPQRSASSSDRAGGRDRPPSRPPQCSRISAASCASRAAFSAVASGLPRDADSRCTSRACGVHTASSSRARPGAGTGRRR